MRLIGVVLASGVVASGALAGAPRPVPFTQLPEALQRIHVGCATPADTVYFSSEKFGAAILFIVSCPAERAVSWPAALSPRYDLDIAASFPVGVYFARDTDARDAQRIAFPVIDEDGTRAKVTTLPVSAEALHEAAAPRASAPPWIEALWKPNARADVCKIMASWRIVDGEAELRRWRVAPTCTKNGPQYETRFSRKVPRLVVQ